MNSLYFLFGALVSLIALPFFVIYLLEQISMNIWNGAHVMAGLQEDMGESRTLSGAKVRTAWSDPGLSGPAKVGKGYQ